MTEIEIVNGVSLVAGLVALFFALNIIVPARVVRKSRKRAVAYTALGALAFALVQVAYVLTW